MSALRRSLYRERIDAELNAWMPSVQRDVEGALNLGAGQLSSFLVRVVEYATGERETMDDDR